MSDHNANVTGYSADVRMQLTVNGHIFPVAQLGPDFLILASVVARSPDHATTFPPAEAQLAVIVDGHERRWPIWLPDGIIAGQRETSIGRCPEINGSKDR